MAETSGLAGLLNPMWLSLIWTKLKSAFARQSHSGLAGFAEGVGFQNAAAQNAESSGARPGHAFQKAATVDSVVVVIVNNSFRHRYCFLSSKQGFVIRRATFQTPAGGDYSRRRRDIGGGNKKGAAESICWESKTRLRNGRRGANMPERFEQVVLPHLDAAYNLARWLMRSPADADDVVQEAYLRALRFFDGFRGGDSRAWLLKIVRNTCYSVGPEESAERTRRRIRRNGAQQRRATRKTPKQSWFRARRVSA